MLPAVRTTPTPIAWPALGLVVLLFLLIQAVTFNQIEEDAFIYLRPAQNILDGHGYVFNHGGPVVETGTSAVWQAIVVLALGYSPWPVTLTLKGIEIAISLVSLWLLTVMASRLLTQRTLVIVPALLLCISVPFYTWSQRGMGSAQHLLVFLWFMHACLFRSRAGWVLPAWLLFISRPEGFAFVAAGLAWHWITRPVRDSLRATLGLGLACFATEFFRILYFHDLLPNSIYYKLRGDLSMGWSVTRLFFAHSPLTLLLVPVLLAAASPRFWNRERAFVAGMTLLGVLWAVIGEDWKEGNRALVPGLTLLCLWIAQALDHWHAHWPRRCEAAVALLVLPILVLSQTAYGFYQHKDNPLVSTLIRAGMDPRHFWAEYRALLANPEEYTQYTSWISDPVLGHNLLATTGKFIAANYPAGITVVYDQIGQTPWYAGTDKAFIDGLGLTDPVIGRFQFDRHAEPPLMQRTYLAVRDGLLQLLTGAPAPRHTLPEILDSIFARRPELIILMNHHDNPAHAVMHGLLHDPRLAEHYYPAYRVNRFNTLYHRKDMPMPAHDRIAAAMQVERLSNQAVSQTGETGPEGS